LVGFVKALAEPGLFAFFEDGLNLATANIGDEQLDRVGANVNDGAAGNKHARGLEQVAADRPSENLVTRATEERQDTSPKKRTTGTGRSFSEFWKRTLFLFLVLFVLLGIALFAGLAVLLGGNAALMRAFLTCFFSSFAATFFAGKRRSGQQRGREGRYRDESDQFHVDPFVWFTPLLPLA
jgi:hypothetical protein